MQTITTYRTSTITGTVIGATEISMVDMGIDAEPNTTQVNES